MPGSRSTRLGGVKIKIGRRPPAQDAERLAAVRDAVGAELDMMVDANQSMTAAEAIRRAGCWRTWTLLVRGAAAGRRRGRARAVAAATSIPIAVGESMYSVGQFAEYLQRGAAGIVQVDVARVGGITPWLKVAHLAEAHNVQVCPHFLMELHVPLLLRGAEQPVPGAHPAAAGDHHRRDQIRDGNARAPTPGLGIDWDRDAIEALTVA